MEEPNMIMTSTLELLSFVAVECSLNGDKIRYMICDELREAVAPHIDKFLTSTEENSRFVLAWTRMRSAIFTPAFLGFLWESS